MPSAIFAKNTRWGSHPSSPKVLATRSRSCGPHDKLVRPQPQSLLCFTSHFLSPRGVGVRAHFEPRSFSFAVCRPRQLRIEPRNSYPLFHGPLSTTHYPPRTSPCVTLRTRCLRRRFSIPVDGPPRSIAAVLLESGGHRAVLDPGPASTLPRLRELLGARGIDVSDLNAILLTHIHLDHAGAVGALIKENPNLEVYVHGTGMRHWPTRPNCSPRGAALAGRTHRLFGETLPVPFEDLRCSRAEKARTREPQFRRNSYAGPRLASRFLFRFDGRHCVCRRYGGFHIEGEPYVVPVAPPPDIDLEAWNASLDAIAARKPARIFLTHFGYSSNPAAHIAAYRKNLKRWGALSAKILRSSPDERSALDAFVAAATAEIKEHVHRRRSRALHFQLRAQPYLARASALSQKTRRSRCWIGGPNGRFLAPKLRWLASEALERT